MEEGPDMPRQRLYDAVAARIGNRLHELKVQVDTIAVEPATRCLTQHGTSIWNLAADVKSILNDEDLFNEAASEAFPFYNKSHLICLQMPNRSGDLLITSFGELEGNAFLDPRTAQVAIVNHVKQVCTEVRPATDEELPSAYIEEFRCSLDAEILKYVEEAYPKGVCSVYCVNGKDVEGPGSDFELAVVISAARHSPQNFCNGSWCSIWNIEFKDDQQTVEVKGKIQVGAHYFEEGNVQLDAKHECKDATLFQAPEDCAVAISSIIRHHETEYLGSLEASYLNLPDSTFKSHMKLLMLATVWSYQIHFILVVVVEVMIFGGSFQSPAPYFHGIILCSSA
ncbi:F-actin-capping protein subunit alpha [Sesbania bispinosa]|nr:F-actin-capping protein subunit alpha [Sesbania bispinosa]